MLILNIKAPTKHLIVYWCYLKLVFNFFFSIRHTTIIPIIETNKIIIVTNKSAGSNGLDDGKIAVSYLIYNNGGAKKTLS